MKKHITNLYSLLQGKNRKVAWAVVPSTVLISALLLFVVGSCKAPKPYPINQETKDYCLFDVGSYWVFQDSATLKTYSITITGIRPDKIWECPECENSREAYYIHYTCFYNDTNETSTGCLINDFSRIDYLEVIYFFSNSFQIPFYFNYHSGNIGTTETASRLGLQVCYENFYSSYEMNNHTYTDVKLFSFGREQKHNMYFAKHIGFIRSEIITPEERVTLNLIRYSVKPYKK